MFSLIIQKVLAGAFHWCGWTHIYLENLPINAQTLFYFHTQNKKELLKQVSGFYGERDLTIPNEI